MGGNGLFGEQVVILLAALLGTLVRHRDHTPDGERDARKNRQPRECGADAVPGTLRRRLNGHVRQFDWKSQSGDKESIQPVPSLADSFQTKIIGRKWAVRASAQYWTF